MNILIDELFKLRLDVKIVSHDFIYILHCFATITKKIQWK